METIIYLIIFIIGALFGSFYTLATYRIPKKQDITHTRSYCPNCNHKLGFFDMFPILSYIFLGGKCRYCKKKISPRYIIIEILSGITFVAMFYLMNIKLYPINMVQVFKFVFLSLFLTFVFITIGIDKENRKIEKSVSVFGIIISLMYIAYLCIIEKAIIYRYVIYIIFYILVLIIDSIALKKLSKDKYINGLIIILITMAVFTGEIVSFMTVIVTVFLICIYELLKKETRKLKDIPIAFYMGIANLLTLTYVLFFQSII